MNPIHLKTFLCVWRHRSYTRAAEELALSQPAVTRQIQGLEQDLGVGLFEQVGRKLHLTSAGETLQEHAERLLGDIDRISETVRAFEKPGGGRLRIGASTTPGLYLVPPLLGAFHRTYPDVQIAYTIDNTVVIERKLLGNELDLAFVGAPASASTLLSRKLVDDEIICFCGRQHPLADRARIAPAALAEEMWIVREPGSATRRLFEPAFQKAGGRLGRMIELNEPEAIKSLVGSGLGISFMSRLGVQESIDAGHLVRLRVTGFSLKRAIYYAVHANKHLTPSMRAFVDSVRDRYKA